jgi:kynurenine aminotransferase
MKRKQENFNQIWNELGFPYSIPQGGYFVLANLSKIKIPANYSFPKHIAERPRDFKLSYFLAHEIGVAAVPPTEFYTDENSHYVQNYLRFAVCQNDDVLEAAKRRLRKLKQYLI